MTRLAAGLLSSILIFAAESGAQIQAPLFQTSSQLVLVPVTVTDRYAKNVEGLRADDFIVYDDHIPQRIASFGTDDAPCSVAIVLDVSGSMYQALGGAKELLNAFFRTSNPADEFQLLTVSTQPEEVASFTTDTASIEDSVGRARAGGLTSLIDTAYLALKRMKAAHQPRRALLILSDGIDNHSRISQSELIGLSLEADVQVYSMIFNTGLSGGAGGGAPFVPAMVAKPWQTARENQGPELLEKLAEKTGGLSFRVRSDAEARDAVVRAARALRSEYLIGFQPAEAKESGKFHQILVKSNVPKLYVRARSGYYAR